MYGRVRQKYKLYFTCRQNRLYLNTSPVGQAYLGLDSPMSETDILVLLGPTEDLERLSKALS